MAGSPHVGLFVWHDLMTLDLDKARHFYGRLYGWTLETEDMGAMGPYHMIHAGGRGIGGMMALDAAHGMPSHWTCYVEVADIERTTRRAQELGGAVCEPPTEIPGIGWFSVLQDPQGAFVLAYQNRPDAPREHLEAPLPSGAGTFCWHELLARDPAAAVPFYTGLFGWGHKVQDFAGMGPYHLFFRGEQFAGGMMPMPPGSDGPPYWLPYVQVADIDRAAALTAELGGTVMVPPTVVPEVGRIAVAQDPTGALFAHFSE